MRLFRPVGLNEIRLIFETEMTVFPPRLPEQPIFYPVLNASYAIKIARDWNTKSEMRAGYVTEFEVEDAYVSRFEPHIVGSREHEELWVPAEELAEFNTHIQWQDSRDRGVLRRRLHGLHTGALWSGWEERE